MKAGDTSRLCNSATNAALLYAAVRRNSRILAKSCNQMLLRRRLRSLSMLASDPSPSVYLPQTAIARPTRTQAQKCCVRVGSSRAVSGNRSLWKSSDEIQYRTVQWNPRLYTGARWCLVESVGSAGSLSVNGACTQDCANFTSGVAVGETSNCDARPRQGVGWSEGVHFPSKARALCNLNTCFEHATRLCE